MKKDDKYKKNCFAYSMQNIIIILILVIIIITTISKIKFGQDITINQQKRKQ